MEYSPPGDQDPACLTGNGDITEVTAKVCRTRPFGTWDHQNVVEAPCLFPFTLNSASHETCILDEVIEFTQPVFRCPIRTVKGIGTDYTDTLPNYCPTNRSV